MASRRRNRNKNTKRRAALILELAIVLPLFLLLIMGGLEIGRYANVAQTVSDASREGVRMAAKRATSSVSDVERFVEDYVLTSYARYPAEKLTEALDVDVTDAWGKSIPEGNLDNVATGASVRVVVTFDSSMLRWVNSYFAKTPMLSTVGVARRE